MYTASISAGSVKSESIKSSTSRRLRSWVPGKWQQVKLIAHSRPQAENGDTAESSPQNFLRVERTVPEDHLMSGALPNDDLCRSNPRRPVCTTGSCSKLLRKPTNLQLKPLPRPPALILGPSKDQASLSPFNISPKISAFGREVETRFLAPLEQQVLQSIQWLSEPPVSRANVLVQLGVDAFWINKRDADMLRRIALLTESLSKKDKDTLLMDLHPLLKPAYRYPLKQVLLHGVRIISARPQTILVNDNESLIDLYSEGGDSENGDTLEKASEQLIPSPLRVRRKGQGVFDGPTHRPHRLSRLSEYSEPGTPISTNRLDGGFEELNPDERSLKQPGSVSRARARLLKLREEAKEQSKQPDSGQPFGSTNSYQGNEPKRPGSVSNARENLFLNPRPVPKPPVSIVRPAPSNGAAGGPQQPGSVTRARIAAQQALMLHGARNPIRPSKFASHQALNAPKQAGNVQRAREAVALHSVDGNKFPRRISSLPLLPIEQRRANLRAGRSPTDRTQFSKQSSLDTLVPPPTAPNFSELKLKDSESDIFPFFRPQISKISTTLPARKPATIRSSPAHPLTPSPPAHPLTSIKPILDLTSFPSFHNHNPSGLRGGASEKEAPKLRRRVSSFFGKVNVLDDEERPHKALWWLAGGRSGRSRRVPTAGELRERKKVEEANREVVGYIGTVFGIRAVRRLPIKPADDEDDDEEEVKAEPKKVMPATVEEVEESEAK